MSHELHCVVHVYQRVEAHHENTDFTTALNDSIKVSCFTGLPQEGNSLKYYSRKEFPSDFYEHFPPLCPARLFSIDHRPPICEINRFRSFLLHWTRLYTDFFPRFIRCIEMKILKRIKKVGSVQ